MNRVWVVEVWTWREDGSSEIEAVDTEVFATAEKAVARGDRLMRDPRHAVFVYQREVL